MGLNSMKICPLCIVELGIMERLGVEIDYCPECRGVWLDRGELEKLIERSAPTSYRDQADRGGSCYQDNNRDSYYDDRHYDDRAGDHHGHRDRHYDRGHHDGNHHGHRDRHYDRGHHDGNYRDEHSNRHHGSGESSHRRRSFLHHLFDF